MRGSGSESYVPFHSGGLPHEVKRGGGIRPDCLKPPFQQNASSLHPFVLYTHLPHMALSFIDSNGKLDHTRRHLYPSVTSPSSPEMTMLSPRNVQMLIVLTERNGLVASIN